MSSAARLNCPSVCRYVKRAPPFRRCATIISSAEAPGTTPDDLVTELLALVANTNGGISAKAPKRKKISAALDSLAEIGKEQSPMSDPQLFGNYTVAFSEAKDVRDGEKSPAAGGLFRTRLGRTLFQTRGVFQHVIPDDTVVNLVAFKVLGLLNGCVSLRGKLSPISDDALGPNAIAVEFERPRLCFGGAVFQFGPRSRVKLATTYLDNRVRLAVGGRGGKFVFARTPDANTAMANEWKAVFDAKPLPTIVLPLFALTVLALLFLAPGAVRVLAVILAALFFVILRRGGTSNSDPGLVIEDGT